MLCAFCANWLKGSAFEDYSDDFLQNYNSEQNSNVLLVFDSNYENQERVFRDNCDTVGDFRFRGCGGAIHPETLCG